MKSGTTRVTRPNHSYLTYLHKTLRSVEIKHDVENPFLNSFASCLAKPSECLVRARNVWIDAESRRKTSAHTTPGPELMQSTNVLPGLSQQKVTDECVVA